MPTTCESNREIVLTNGECSVCPDYQLPDSAKRRCYTQTCSSNSSVQRDGTCSYRGGSSISLATCTTRQIRNS